MNEMIRLLLLHNDGVASARELATLGLDCHAIRDLVRRSDLVRVRAGAFVDGATFRDATALDRHVLAARAMVRRMPGYALSHLSAVAVHGLPVIAADLGPVEVCQIGAGHSRRSGSLLVHLPVAEAEVVECAGATTVDAGVAVLQSAERSMRAGLVAADAAIRTGLLSKEDLTAVAERRGCNVAAFRVARLASGLSESPGESWTRLVLAGLGLHAEQQVEIRDGRGRFVARVDFLLPEQRVIIEFDGAVKYDGAQGREALVREKRREDALRALGYRIVRLTWADLADPQQVAAALGLRPLRAT